MSKLIVVIDGDCQFCQFSARLLRKMVRQDMTILFQSDPLVTGLEKEIPSSNWAIDSIKLVQGSQVYIKSEAIALIFRDIRFVYQPLRLIFILPKALLDRVYDWVATNRYFWNRACSINVQEDRV